jgi:diaminohydroxyphosphoribosylaminopyrimidine deaminase / 5-amino-6-(5-phosphoribosylamino)uracil reductase
LRAAGIAVDAGLGAEEATEINAGFLTRLALGRPLVTLKLATSLDGRIATSTGESRWITGAAARARAHLLRATHDAVMVGSNTVVADDPLLTCRLGGLERRSPVRIVVDGRLRVPLTARVVSGAHEPPTWLLVGPGADPARRLAFAECGVELLETKRVATGELDLADGMKELGRRGITRLLVEGGGGLAAALFAADLVDRVQWFRAPMVLGGDGRAAVAPFGLTALHSAPRFERRSVELVGEDVLETFERAD